MMSKKKKKSLPKRKRLERPQRLQQAKKWLQEFNGKRTVRAYEKYFGVDW